MLIFMNIDKCITSEVHCLIVFINAWSIRSLCLYISDACKNWENEKPPFEKRSILKANLLKPASKFWPDLPV